MKKRVTFTVDEDIVQTLRMLPRGLSISDFVNSMLRELLLRMGVVNLSHEELSDQVDPISVSTVDKWLMENWSASPVSTNKGKSTTQKKGKAPRGRKK